MGERWEQDGGKVGTRWEAGIRCHFPVFSHSFIRSPSFRETCPRLLATCHIRGQDFTCDMVSLSHTRRHTVPHYFITYGHGYNTGSRRERGGNETGSRREAMIRCHFPLRFAHPRYARLSLERGISMSVTPDRRSHSRPGAAHVTPFRCHTLRSTYFLYSGTRREGGKQAGSDASLLLTHPNKSLIRSWHDLGCFTCCAACTSCLAFSSIAVR